MLFLNTVKLNSVMCTACYFKCTHNIKEQRKSHEQFPASKREEMSTDIQILNPSF